MSCGQETNLFLNQEAMRVFCYNSTIYPTYLIHSADTPLTSGMKAMSSFGVQCVFWIVTFCTALHLYRVLSYRSVPPYPNSQNPNMGTEWSQIHFWTNPSSSQLPLPVLWNSGTRFIWMRWYSLPFKLLPPELRNRKNLDSKGFSTHYFICTLKTVFLLHYLLDLQHLLNCVLSSF